ISLVVGFAINGANICLLPGSAGTDYTLVTRDCNTNTGEYLGEFICCIDTATTAPINYGTISNWSDIAVSFSEQPITTTVTTTATVTSTVTTTATVTSTNTVTSTTTISFTTTLTTTVFSTVTSTLTVFSATTTTTITSTTTVTAPPVMGMDILTILFFLMVDVALVLIGLRYNATIFCNLGGLTALFGLAWLVNSGSVNFITIPGNGSDYNVLVVVCIMMTIVSFLFSYGIGKSLKK